ncbi:nuclear transport factor 2 family protein [Bradyrhizobium sp. CSA112]|uniref:YybH family protein n=1 Tax=Bradyrhizobium sp. CSA112 TaxID=2699170 RepID=UPI0023B188D1|nr:nuclear transport factor 2 family protein [Bradyrhizobium sp. CSA112]
MTVTEPAQMNEAFAQAFNSRNIDNLLALYEMDAVLRVDGSERSLIGLDAIAGDLQRLLQAPGTLTSRNNFCVQHSDVALLRADWELRTQDGSIVASGSSAELVRRQSDGTWRYVIDHAVGASLPRVS